MKKKLILVTAIVAAILMILQPITASKVTAETATGTKVTYKGSVSAMGSTCGKFTIKDNYAFCAEHSKTTPPSGTKITSTKLVTNKEMRKALYYGYGGPKAKVSKNDSGWVSTSIALSRANGKGGGTTAAQKFYNSLKNYSVPPDSFKVYYCKTTGSLQDLCYWVYKPEGDIRIKKQSTDADATTDRGYSLEGAVYGVYTKKTCTSDSRVTKLTTDAVGVSGRVTLDKGTYYIKEITAPTGFELNSTVYTVKVTDQCDKTVTVKDIPKRGNIQLLKASADPEKTDGNDRYSLAGAKYGVWSDPELTKSIGVLTTKSDGKSDGISVLAGAYYIKEITAPKGYLKDETVYKMEIGIDDLEKTEVLEVKDIPEKNPPWVIIQKIDAETGEPVPSGDGELSGAEFTVKYYEGTDWTEDPAKSGAKEKDKWVFETNENGCVVLDDPWFPVGTITIQETKAPKGYNRNEEVFMIKIVEDFKSPGVSLKGIPTTEVKQQPIRGDVEIIKSDSKTGERMAGVVFEVIDVSENKVMATLTTDEKGYASTASGKTNGSLLYGEYIVKEKETPAGYLPIDNIRITISENKEVVKLDIKNTPAEIKTKAFFKDNREKEILPGQSITIVDEVSYKNLIPGNEYRISGILMDQKTGEPLAVNDEHVTSEIEFNAEQADGSINLEFTLDGTSLSGKTVTVFEYMYINDTLIASHADINDTEQTVRFTGVGDIEIYKGDSATGLPLKGVKFEVINKLNGEVLAVLVTDESGYATTAKDEMPAGSLLYGDYIVRETEPLPGYAAIDDMEVTLDEVNQTMSLKVDNTPIPVVEEKSPGTGDTMGRIIPLTIAFLIISLMGLLVSVKRKEE